MLFPDYDVPSPVISTARTIDRCVARARERIEQHEKEILTAARTIDRQATIMLTVALNKLSHVQRIPLDDAWGQASDTAIAWQRYSKRVGDAARLVFGVDVAARPAAASACLRHLAAGTQGS